MEERPTFSRTTSTPLQRRARQQTRSGAVYAAVIFVVLFASYRALSGPGASSAPLGGNCSGPGCLPQVAAQLKPAPTPFSGTVPCPYCGRDANAWQRQTNVTPPEIGGKAAAVIEGDCGKLIFGLHEDERLAPASLTKIVTAMVTRDRADLNDRVPISINGWDLSADDGSTIMGLEAGMNLSVEELLYGLLLPSGNDAAYALADKLGGVNTFVVAMNEKVRRAGLRNTQFTTPDGRDSDGQYSTPFDIALLGRQLLLDPVLTRMVGTISYMPNWSGPLLWNANYLLLDYQGAEGVKIGYTEKANYTIVSAATRDGRRLIVSVMGSWNLYGDSERLMDWAFQNTKWACD